MLLLSLVIIISKSRYMRQFISTEGYIPSVIPAGMNDGIAPRLILLLRRLFFFIPWRNRLPIKL